MNLREKIDLNKLPDHIAVIMDGNGRWAKKHGEIRTFGHEHGIRSVRTASETCAELGVKYLTLYTFSTENWNRPQEEVDAIMNLLAITVSGEKETLIKNDIKLSIIGDLKKLPQECQEKLKEVVDVTKDNKRLTLTLALNYSGRWELINAMKKIAIKVKDGELSPSEIDEKVVNQFLETKSIPDPELLIRTSGEMRISNFLLWQVAYSEIYVTDVLWPDFSEDDLYEAILSYQNRERRFGKTSEQILAS